MKNSNSLTTKRFVIRKSLLGKNTVITFTNKKGDTITYNYIFYFVETFQVLLARVQHFTDQIRYNIDNIYVTNK